MPRRSVVDHQPFFTVLFILLVLIIIVVLVVMWPLSVRRWRVVLVIVVGRQLEIGRGGAPAQQQLVLQLLAAAVAALPSLEQEHGIVVEDQVLTAPHPTFGLAQQVLGSAICCPRVP